MTRHKIYLSIAAMLGAIHCQSNSVNADAYAFAGLTVDNFIIFKDDSVSDPMDL